MALESKTSIHLNLKRKWENNPLKLSQPGVGHDGSEDWGEVAESHKSVVDGSGQVIVPVQEVLEVQHKHSCGEAEKK